MLKSKKFFLHQDIICAIISKYLRSKVNSSWNMKSRYHYHYVSKHCCSTLLFCLFDYRLRKHIKILCKYKLWHCLAFFNQYMDISYDGGKLEIQFDPNMHDTLLDFGLVLFRDGWIVAPTDWILKCFIFMKKHMYNLFKGRKLGTWIWLHIVWGYTVSCDWVQKCPWRTMNWDI